LRSDWAASLNNLGQFLIQVGRRAEAEPLLRQALEPRERLARDHPAVLQYAIDLAGADGNFGRLHRLSEHPEASLEWFDRAIQTSRDVRRREPRSEEARSILRNAFASRSRARGTLKQYTGALADVEQALEIEGDGPRRADLRQDRAAHLVRLGDHARAAAEVEALVPGLQRDGAALYDLACVLSLAASAARNDGRLGPVEAGRRAEAYAARAVALLNSAHRTGFFARPGAVDGFVRDPDLDSIRTREDFRAALLDWTFPADPFVR
jgi:tetratricopeptide (TPR) repeat protein